MEALRIITEEHQNLWRIASTIDLVADDPNQARDLLTDAYARLDAAEAAKVKATVIAPLRNA